MTGSPLRRPMAWHAAAAVLLLAAALAGCTYDSSGANSGASAGPGGGKSVSNNPGSFTYSVGGAFSGTDTYTWKNPSATARISFSAGGSGSVSVLVQDSAGKTVYSKSFSGSGGSSSDQRSSPGVPGDWAIRITTSGAGGFSLSVQSG